MNPGLSIAILQAVCAAVCFWIAWTLINNPKPPKRS